MTLSSSHDTANRSSRSAAKNAATTSTMPTTICAARVPRIISSTR
jgi:hypothetical protein